MHYNALAAKGIIQSPITSCSTRDHSVDAAFAENGIGREGVTGVAQRGRSLIYYCLVFILFSGNYFYFVNYRSHREVMFASRRYFLNMHPGSKRDC